jgi:endonuclease/exonuclease/phosphatase family metal-dependent hydrolase
MKFTSFSFLLSSILLLLFQDTANALPNKVISDKEECSEDDRNLKILSWNIYMLPKIVVQRNKRIRAHAIVEELKKSDFDIIVFQEAFLPAAREIIKAGLGNLYPFQFGPANSEGFTLKTNSGVWIISKVPLKLLKTTQFKNCTGNDCWARKGAMLLEGVWGDKAFQILGTHLQADGFDKIREKQMDQIYNELLAENKKEGVPQIICGDMNTEREMNEHYCKMLDCLDAQDGEISGIEKCSYDGVNNNIAQSFGIKKKTNFDYILVRNNGSKMRSTNRSVSILKKGKKFLSDHYGVVCELKF